MLVNLKITNFRSFNDEQEFSMETGKRLSKFKSTNTFNFRKKNLLKSSLIFGANANGKTNVLKALSTIRSLVTKPTTDEIQELNADTFASNDGNTKFDITFIKNSHEFEYLIEYNKNEIVHESLLFNSEIVFNREYQNFLEIPDQLKPISVNVRKNQNFLNFAQQNNEVKSKEAYSWFVKDLILVNTDNIPNIAFKALEDPDFKRRFLNFLRAADFNIVDVEIRERVTKVPNPEMILRRLSKADEEDIDNFIDSTVYDLYSTHSGKNGNFKLYFDNESTGTKVFIFLALYVLTNKNKVLIIDEFEKSYHLELAQALLSLINSEYQTNQFILTTHELTLMDCSMRQDQIWFAEKNRYGESELFSLFDFDDPSLKRQDYNYKKRYLEGRYGATQIVNTQLLLEALNNE